MGMTDKQFNGYILLVLDALEEIREQVDPSKENSKLTKLIEHLRDTIED
ncbi:MAG: hypothetical protein IKN81_09335 [Oscillospiraceae bacterium]|nr:hypothetical protein [Oscillospiraceae bacterium]